jgi:hypothetical protein
LSEESAAVQGLLKLLARWQGWVTQSEGSGFGPPLWGASARGREGRELKFRRRQAFPWESWATDEFD